MTIIRRKWKDFVYMDIWCRHTANISVFIFYKISMNNVYCMKYLSQDLQVIKARFFSILCLPLHQYFLPLFLRN